ncbi:MAG: hypothetical protein AAGC44_13955 [Planctomycetota bacterium]
MNRVYQHAMLVLCLLFISTAVAQPGHTEIDLTRDAGWVTGQCLEYREKSRLIEDRLEQAIRVPSERLKAVAAALRVVANPRPPQVQRVEAQLVDTQTAVYRERIVRLRRLLRGELRPEDEVMSRSEVLSMIDHLHQEVARFTLLAKAYHAEDPWDRQRLQGLLALEKIELEELIQQRREPYRVMQDQLKNQAQGLSDNLDRVMHPYGRQARVGEVETEAVRVSSRYEHGLIQFRWLDRRGQLVASAHLNLRSRPDTDRTPPLLNDRYPVVEQNQQEVTLGVGYFEVRFRADDQNLAGDRRVLDAVQKLLDLEGLSRLVPRVGGESTN